MSEVWKPGDLSPDGKLRLRDPVELGWDVVAQEVELELIEEVTDEPRTP